LGSFGSEDRLDDTSVGGAVNVAVRLEATAEANQIQIAHATYSLVDNNSRSCPIGQQKEIKPATEAGAAKKVVA
jgi:class 3 adenylate cyclase